MKKSIVLMGILFTLAGCGNHDMSDSSSNSHISSNDSSLSHQSSPLENESNSSSNVLSSDVILPPTGA